MRGILVDCNFRNHDSLFRYRHGSDWRKEYCGLPDAFTSVGIATVYGVPVIFIEFILIMLVMAVFPQKTGNGRKLYLFGGNPVASLFSGINNNRITVLLFTSIGFLAGLAGLTIIYACYFLKVGYGDAYIFQALIVCVIAGIHPAGGKGKVIGIGITTLLMQMAASAFTIMQLSPIYHEAYLGRDAYYCIGSN